MHDKYYHSYIIRIDMVPEKFRMLLIDRTANWAFLAHEFINNKFLGDEKEALLRWYISFGKKPNQLPIITKSDRIIHSWKFGAIFFEPCQEILIL